MSRIEVDINPDENTIRVWNNGAGIPIAIHQEHNIYVPELIFGHLLTGKLITYFIIINIIIKITIYRK